MQTQLQQTQLPHPQRAAPTGEGARLGARLLLVLLAGLFPLLAYALIAAEATRHASLDWLETELHDAARQAATREAAVLDEAGRLLGAMAATPLPTAGPAAVCRVLAPVLAGASASVSALAVHLPDGSLACMLSTPAAGPTVPALGAGHVRAALAAPAVAADPEAGLILARAMAGGTAVIALALSPDHLPPLALPLHREQAARLLVDLDDGMVLAASPGAAARAGQPLGFPQVLAAARAARDGGTLVARDGGGVARLVGHAAVPGDGSLALLIELPYAPLLSESLARRNEQWMILGALLLVGAVTAWLLAREAVLRPLLGMRSLLPGRSPPQAQMLATMRPAAAWLRQQGDLAAVADAAGEMFLRLDADLRVTYASPGTRRILGYAPAEVVDADLAAEPGWEPCQTVLAALRDGAARTEPCAIVARRRDDGQVRLEVRATRLSDGGFMLACRDIGAELVLRRQLEEAQRRLAALALADRPTGLSSRQRFDEALAQELGRARRGQEPISVVLLRLVAWDDAAARLGRPKAEEALRRVGRIMLATLRRPADLAARLEDDLFAVLLPTTDRIGAQRVAERLQEAMAAEWRGETAPATRIGACSVVPQDNSDTPDSLLGLAHSALQEAEGGVAIRVPALG